VAKNERGRTVVVTVSVTETDLREIDAAIRRGKFKNRSVAFREGIARLRVLRAI
jgi:Arc/MetJ-type ribon-helix-helix transcriptional regulator